MKRKAKVTRGRCVACGCCVKACPVGAITVAGGQYARVEESRCVGCGRCQRACPADIIEMEERA